MYLRYLINYIRRSKIFDNNGDIRALAIFSSVTDITSFNANSHKRLKGIVNCIKNILYVKKKNKYFFNSKEANNNKKIWFKLKKTKLILAKTHKNTHFQIIIIIIINFWHQLSKSQ